MPDKPKQTEDIHQSVFEIMKQIKDGYQDYPQYPVIMQSLSKVATELNAIRISDITGMNREPEKRNSHAPESRQI